MLYIVNFKIIAKYNKHITGVKTEKNLVNI